MTALIYAIIFIYGIIVGSFLNVCIYRIPKQETIVSERSHCMNCGHKLSWYDLFPLFSWLFLRGKCRYCKAKISKQYPIIEALNGVMWVLIFVFQGFNFYSIMLCLMVSALIVISVIDFRTYEIPAGLNMFIFVLGVINIIVSLINKQNVVTYIVGLFLVSTIFNLVFRLSGGRAMGYGDVKLMGAAGLLIGWKLIFTAMLFGCLYGSVIHSIRMKVSNEEHVLAFGPYLSMGIVTAVLFGDKIINWYISLVF